MNSKGPGASAWGGFLAFATPLAGSLWHAVETPLLRSDAAVTGNLAEGLGWSGIPQHVLASACAFLPIGAAAARGTLVGALAAGLAGYAVFVLALDLCRRHGGHSSLDGWLGLAAAWSSTLGASWLVESTVLGGAAPGAALALGLLALTRTAPRLPAWLFGVLFAVVCAESAWCGAAVGLALLVEPGTHWLSARSGQAIGAALGTLGLAFAPLFTAGRPPTFEVDWGSAWPWSLAQWGSEVGLVFGLAMPVAVALALGRRNSGLWPLVAALAVDVISPYAGAPGALGADPSSARLALHLLALALVPALGCLALRGLGEGAKALRLYGASAVRPLVAVLAIASTLAGAEDAWRVQAGLPLAGARTFTDSTLGALPPRALVLVHSDDLSRRLLAAGAAHERPDVLVVPMAWLGRVSLMRSLLVAEPQLEQLIRDLNVGGTPSEHALSLLSDARPVFVEADPQWDRRLLEHLVPLPLLAGFSTNALARSDRLAAWQSRFADLEPWTLGNPPDAETPAVDRLVERSLEQLRAALETAGDRKMAQLVARRQRNFEAPSANPTAPSGTTAAALVAERR